MNVHEKHAQVRKWFLKRTIDQVYLLRKHGENPPMHIKACKTFSKNYLFFVFKQIKHTVIIHNFMYKIDLYYSFPDLKIISQYEF